LSEDNNISFGKRLKKSLDAKAIALILLIIWTAGEKMLETYSKGREAQEIKFVESVFDGNKFSEKVESEFRSQMQDPFVLHQVLESPSVTNFTKEAREDIEQTLYDKFMEEDSTRISLITYLGQKTGLRDEVVEEKFAKMFELFVSGDLITKSEAERMIYVRRVRADF
jgi:hypothetical protein